VRGRSVVEPGGARGAVVVGAVSRGRRASHMPRAARSSCCCCWGRGCRAVSRGRCPESDRAVPCARGRGRGRGRLALYVAACDLSSLRRRRLPARSATQRDSGNDYWLASSLE
jgi:hypothetical protein